VHRRVTGSVVGGTGLALLALLTPIVTAGSAHAADKKSKCAPATIEWSVDGGKTWSKAGLLGGFHGKMRVRIANTVDKSCKYKVTLASYSAEGPTWKTSGRQDYLGSKTVTLRGKGKAATLDITRYLPPCFGQLDLYGNGKIFDGKANPLPRYPDAKYPTEMIAGWNGGKKCAPIPPTTSPPTTPPPTSSPPTTTPTSTPPATTAPPSTAPPVSSPPTTEPPTTEPPVVDEDETPQDEQRAPAPAANVPGELAQTGANDSLWRIAGASVALLLSCVGALLLVRTNPRRRAGGRGAAA